MSGNDIGEWYKSIPIVSKYWFTGSVILPLLGKIGFVNPYMMLLLWEPFIEKFHIWRPITALFYYPISPQSGFHYLINLYFLYSYSTRLESGIFSGKPADYLFMLIFNWICLVLIGFGAPLYLLMDPMIISVLYIWCQLNKDTIVQFWFGTQFKAMYLPWILVAFNIIIQGGGFTELLGIVVGHLYFFLMFKYPQEFGGNVWLRTPRILYKWLPNRSGGISGFGMPPASARTSGGDNGSSSRPRFPGRGQTLGD